MALVASYMYMYMPAANWTVNYMNIHVHVEITRFMADYETVTFTNYQSYVSNVYLFETFGICCLTFTSDT